MLQHSAQVITSSQGTDPADRRAHPRILSAKLAISRVRIANRPAVSLVDLSSGGALLNLPFQLPPESRIALLLDTPATRLDIPFQLIRCYVSTLRGGVTYHAAGAFDRPLDLHAIAQRSSGARARLVDAVERLRRGVRKGANRSRSDAAFDEILGAVMLWLREDDSCDLVTLKVKAHLTQTYPSLMIVPSLLPSHDEFNSVACFGLTLRSRYTLSAHDRRYLKAHAQLISMLEDAKRDQREEAGVGPQIRRGLEMIRTAADWQCLPKSAPEPVAMIA
jgi:hypothetical protein